MGRKKRKILRGELEISVEDAAKRLGLTPRMINNYIKDKKLRAVKVSGQWFIDAVSVDALGQSYGFKPTTSPAATPSVSESAPPPLASQSKVLPRPKKGEKRSSGTNGPSKLAVYRLMQEGFSMSGWRRLDSVLPASWLESLEISQRRIYEYLGSGYYTWGPDKIEYYRRVRSIVGGILGLMHSKKEYSDSVISEIRFLEGRVLPALTALLIRMESPRPRRRKSP